MTLPGVRLDTLLAERGLVDSRSRAQALIMAGRVSVAGRVVTKAGAAVPEDADVAVTEPPRFVSRGGDKLAVALEAFGVDVTGERCIDVGASTGGFVDCLLQAGATAVIAVDVGRGQLHDRVRRDERVSVLDGVNARYLQPEQLPFVPNLCTIDASFISLGLILPAAIRCLAPPYRVIPLVKPQFEAGRSQAKRGVVHDPEVRLSVLARVASLAQGLGLVVLDACASGHPGPAGNREFFLHLVSPDHPDARHAPDDIAAVLARATG